MYYYFFVKYIFIACQEQIELSGFVANELSAFSVHKRGLFLNRRLRADVPFLDRDYGRELPTTISRLALQKLREIGCG